MNFLKRKYYFPEKIKKIFRRIFKVVAMIVIIATIGMVWITQITIFDFDNDFNDFSTENGECEQESYCEGNVAVIVLHGGLITYISPENLSAEGYLISDLVSSEEIVRGIEEAEKNNNVKAIILEIDSYGGSPVAAEEISNALKNTKKPTVALIRQGGVSAAYLAATGANRIFASKNSDVGSIGVTMSYLDVSRQNQKEGLTYNQLSSGKFKDAGDPNKVLSLEEKKLLMRDVDILHQNFIKAVAENRKIDIKKVESLADGSTILGEMALKNGLIDQVGGIFEVKKYLKEKIEEEVKICW